jgi:Tfp pilus assembly protein PilV
MEQSTNNMNYQLKNKGQSLLEVTVLVGLVLIVISGLVIVTVNGLKNSQYSQNQAQATKLAQEGMDQVKNIASRNCSVSIGGSFLWFNSIANGTDLIWNRDWSSGPTFYISNYSSCSTSIAGLTQTNAGRPYDIIPSANNIFTRNITITDDSSCQTPTKCKIVTISVNWNDYSGLHESRLATILTENL